MPVLAVESDDHILLMDKPLSAQLAASGVPGTLINGYFALPYQYRAVVERMQASGSVSHIVTRRHGYKPRGVYQIRTHQELLVDFYLKYTRGYNLAGMGAGKSSATLWAFDILRDAGSVNKLLVISPLSTLEPAWGDDAARATPHLRVAQLVGDKRKRSKLLIDDKHDVYVINHDGIKVVDTVVADWVRRNQVMVVVDEATAISTYNSARSEATRRVTKAAKRVYALTATPVAQSLMHAHGIMLYVNNNPAVPRTMTDYRAQFFIKQGMYKYIAKPDAMARIQTLMSPAIYMATRDIASLPDNVVMHRYPSLTAEQAAAYKDMQDEMMHEAQPGVVIQAVNAGVQLMKLAQITCGILIGNETTVSLPPKHKFADLCSLIDQAEGKVIVYVPFTAAIHWIHAELNKLYGDGFAVIMDGSVSGNKRGAVVRDFQDEESATRVLVVQPRAASHGITLTAADTVVWFAPIVYTEVFVQANCRHDRPGQKRVTKTVLLASTQTERDMYEVSLRGETENKNFVTIYSAVISGGK